MAYINPFRPQNPVSRGMFVGRKNEIRRLESVLNHAKSQQPTNFMITGERGIGKTSLLMYLGAIAQSYGDVEEERYNFLKADVVIDSSTNQYDLIKKIESALQRELKRNGIKTQVLEKVWGFLQRVEVSGFRIDPSQPADPSHKLLAEEFGNSIVALVDKLCRPGEPDRILGPVDFDGILILIDEADQASTQLDLGSFLKYFAEFLNRNGCSKVTIGLSGLDGLSDVLTASHPSSLRVFEEIPLARLSTRDANDLIDTCLDRGDDRLAHGIDTQARELLNELAEGHPHFLHQFGYSAFNAAVEDPRARIISTQEELHFDEEDLDAEITIEEIEVDKAVLVSVRHVMKGALDSRGALEVIGDIYFQKFYHSLTNHQLRLKIVMFLCDQISGGCTAAGIASAIGEDVVAVEDEMSGLADEEHIFHDRFSNTYRVRFSCFGRWVQLKTQKVTLAGDSASFS